MARLMILIVLLTMAFCPPACGEVYDGVELPLGDRSFADRWVSYGPGSNVGPPYDDPTRALGRLDEVAVALGDNGTLVLEFTDNELVDQDVVEGGQDLFIFESGDAVESFRLEISKDGLSFIYLGTFSEQPTGIDIGPHVSPGDSFSFVRLTDAGDGRSGYPWAGADINAVGAIGVPEPTLAGDTNYDGDVDFDDFNTLANNYTGTGGSGRSWGDGDFDGDGDVDFSDFNDLANNYTGPGGGGKAVPEPSTVVLLCISAVGLLAHTLRRRRRARAQ